MTTQRCPAGTVTVTPESTVIGPTLIPFVPLAKVKFAVMLFDTTYMGGLLFGNAVPVPPPDDGITVSAILLPLHCLICQSDLKSHIK